MANIGAEVGRTFNARRTGMPDRYWAAIERAVDLFEATVLTIPDPVRYRLREVGRAKDKFLRIATDEPFDDEDARKLEDYLTNIAILSRAAHFAEQDARPGVVHHRRWTLRLTASTSSRCLP